MQFRDYILGLGLRDFRHVICSVLEIIGIWVQDLGILGILGIVGFSDHKVLGL